jgi:predicted esterase
MVALAAFLKYNGSKPIGGFIGLSTLQALNYTKYVHFKNDTERKRVEDLRRNTPMFLYHGREDWIIRLAPSIVSFDNLRNKVYKGSDKLEFHVEEDMDHEFTEKEKYTLGVFIHKFTD